MNSRCKEALEKFKTSKKRKRGKSMTYAVESKVPQQALEAAHKAWKMVVDDLSTISVSPTAPQVSGRKDTSAIGEKSYVEMMLIKIDRRMKQYPEWYESNPNKMAAIAATKLEQIGEILKRELPKSTDVVPVWEIPLSVFNRRTPESPGFVRNSLCAWSCAQDFNAANGAHRVGLRQRFLKIAPPLLRAVTDPILEYGFWVFFSQKSTGSEYTHLVMQVQRPRS